MGDASPPLDLKELTALATRFTERGLYEEALELYRVALRLDPTDPGVKVGLAQARQLRRRQRRWRERSPEDAVREKARRNSIDAAHFLGLAYLYSDQERPERAMACLEIAKAKDPTNPALYKLHGRILYRQGDPEGAARELDKAHRFNPFDREIAEELGRVHFERQDFLAALRFSIHAFLLVDPEDADRLGAGQEAHPHPEADPGHRQRRAHQALPPPAGPPPDRLRTPRVAP